VVVAAEGAHAPVGQVVGRSRGSSHTVGVDRNACVGVVPAGDGWGLQMGAVAAQTAGDKHAVEDGVAAAHGGAGLAVGSNTHMVGIP